MSVAPRSLPDDAARTTALTRHDRSLLVEAGAEVHGLDYKETQLKLASFTSLDLRDPASIDTAVARIGGKVDPSQRFSLSVPLD